MVSPGEVLRGGERESKRSALTRNFIIWRMNKHGVKERKFDLEAARKAREAKTHELEGHGPDYDPKARREEIERIEHRRHSESTKLLHGRRIPKKKTVLSKQGLRKKADDANRRIAAHVRSMKRVRRPDDLIGAVRLLEEMEAKREIHYVQGPTLEAVYRTFREGEKREQLKKSRELRRILDVLEREMERRKKLFRGESARPDLPRLESRAGLSRLIEELEAPEEEKERYRRFFEGQDMETIMTEWNFWSKTFEDYPPEVATSLLLDTYADDMGEMSLVFDGVGYNATGRKMENVYENEGFRSWLWDTALKNPEVFAYVYDADTEGLDQQQVSQWVGKTLSPEEIEKWETAGLGEAGGRETEAAAKIVEGGGGIMPAVGERPPVEAERLPEGAFREEIDRVLGENPGGLPGLWSVKKTQLEESDPWAWEAFKADFKTTFDSLYLRRDEKTGRVDYEFRDEVDALKLPAEEIGLLKEVYGDERTVKMLSQNIDRNVGCSYVLGNIEESYDSLLKDEESMTGFEKLVLKIINQMTEWLNSNETPEVLKEAIEDRKKMFLDGITDGIQKHGETDAKKPYARLYRTIEEAAEEKSKDFYDDPLFIPQTPFTYH